jgi:hypothetical protein
MAGLALASRLEEFCASRLGITGTRPVMTWEDVFPGRTASAQGWCIERESGNRFCVKRCDKPKA